jgi:hypothetical protein
MTRAIPKACACCDQIFFAGHNASRYCSLNCKQTAYYRRRKVRDGLLLAAVGPHVVQPEILDDPDELPASWAKAAEPAGLECRTWNGTAIHRRQSDGYVNATAMCKAGGREWSTYARSQRTKEYVDAMQAVPQFCRTELVQSVWGGQPHLQGTWIHPRLAVDLARWISPAFAVWMDGWFLESLAPALQPVRQPLEPGVHVVAASQRGAAMIWHEVVTAEVNAALARLSPRCRTNDGLPVSHHYTFTPATGKLQA